jgi:hypothetical protein
MGSSTPDLANAAWRKSSYSGDTGGDCVECAPLGSAAWRKSSYSGDTGGHCVEIATTPARVAVRDSKQADGPALCFPSQGWGSFVKSAKTGVFQGESA